MHHILHGVCMFCVQNVKWEDKLKLSHECSCLKKYLKVVSDAVHEQMYGSYCTTALYTHHNNQKKLVLTIIIVVFSG